MLAGEVGNPGLWADAVGAMAGDATGCDDFAGGGITRRQRPICCPCRTAWG